MRRSRCDLRKYLERDGMPCLVRRGVRSVTKRLCPCTANMSRLSQWKKSWKPKNKSRNDIVSVFRLEYSRCDARRDNEIATPISLRTTKPTGTCGCHSQEGVSAPAWKINNERLNALENNEKRDDAVGGLIDTERLTPDSLSSQNVDCGAF